MTTIEIQSNCPPPVPRTKPEFYTRRMTEQMRATVLAMKVGDSFVTDIPTGYCVLSFARKHGINLSRRKEGDLLRIWRLNGDPAAASTGPEASNQE